MLHLDQLSSSYLVILLLVIVVATTGALFRTGLIEWAVAIVVAVIRGGIQWGFELWKKFFSRATLPTFAFIVVSSLFVGWLTAQILPLLTLACAFVPLFMGVTACLAYMFIDRERYEVSRGYKVVHNPIKGQELALNIVQYGQAVGVPLLVTASLGMVGGFAMLNFGLFQSIGRTWYAINEGQGDPTYVDFLANTLIVLLRIVDVLDFANSSHLLEVCYVRQATWPAKTLLTVFRTFFTVVLLQQVFASFRQGLILSETIEDLWSPHQPIHERAFHALPQYGAGAIDPLLTSLGSVTSLTKEQREHLPQMLANIGPGATPALIRHLHDDHEQVRAVAAGALGHLQIRGTIVLLAPLCEDSSDIVRQSLSEALGIIASASPHRDDAAVTFLSPRSRLWQSFKRKSNAQEISTLEPVELAVKTLNAALSDRSLAVRAQAAKSLGRIGAPASVATSGLIALLQDEDETVRNEAIEAVGKVCGPSAVVVEALIKALQDASPLLRASTAKELGLLGEAAASAFTALAPLLQDHEASVREAAADAIGRIGRLDNQDAGNLAEGLTSPDSVVRAQTAEALGEIGESAHETAAALVESLKDQNDMVRAKAVEALGKIGEAAADVAVPGLVRALRDEDNFVSSLAAEALGQMGEAADSAIPSLVRSLKHINSEVRANAAEALGKLGAEAKSSIAALERTCLDDVPTVRENCIRALGLIDFPTDATRQRVCDGLRDEDSQVRLASVDAICHWGEHDKATLVELLSMLEDSNEQVRARVTTVLPQLAGPTPTVISSLCQRLRDDTDLVQAQAAEALGQLGAAAASAGESLLHSAKTGEIHVRDRAIQAIKAIRPADFYASQDPAEVDPTLIEELREIEQQTSHVTKERDVDEIPVIVTSVVDPETGKQVEAAIALEIVANDEPGADAD